ncbi:MAG TPA: dihydrolipoyllysine-residue acetyltransferase [Casimicrobiaceae bacterium]|nr:dihydrolipoyllysine-residue acetyltransferase [Casimicrobiaceae bacterium]
MNVIEVKVPDIGDFADIPVIDVLVKPGDVVAVDDSLITLESDKATMDVPSPAAGVVRDLRVRAGDKVSEGSLVLTLDGSPAKAGDAEAKAPTGDGIRHAQSISGTLSPMPAPERETPAPRGEKGRADAPGEGSNSTPPAGPTIEVRVPKIGDFADVPVIEVFVKPGDIVKPDDPLVTLESDKATMDVPSPVGGIVEGVRVEVGERVREGTALLSLKTSETGAEPASRATPPSHPDDSDRATPPVSAGNARASSAEARESESDHRESSRVRRAESDEQQRASDASGAPAVHPHASPSVRKFARELGANLAEVEGSGPRGRIVKEDVQAFVKEALTGEQGRPMQAAKPTGAGLELLPWPSPDFSKFGPTESAALSRIRKISGANLARNWVMVPHVTQFEDADITDLETLRVELNREQAKAGVKVTMLAFLIKASVAALRKFPDFNASLDATGTTLTRKHYFNIGFAADTPNGLVVPVLKDADQKGVVEIAKEMMELSAKARDGKLAPADMQGGCFSISSLGGIGGTAFTPIVNAPEAAILGVSKSAMKPVWDGTAFVPRLMLPLSLSYDHRVIDGAQAARFTTYLAGLLADFRRALL